MKKILILSTLLPIMAMAYEPTYSIKSTVWNDRNQNWEIDNEEKGIRNVKVVLYDHTGKAIRSTETRWNGEYTLSYIKEGDYTIKVEVPKGMSAITETSLELYLNKSISIDKNTADDKNFGLYDAKEKGDLTLGGLGSKVWNDTNKNWEIDNGEKGVFGVTVNLYSNGTQVATTKTDSEGYYKFKNLAEGEYVIKIQLPKNMSAVTNSETSLYLEKSETGRNFGIFDKNHKGDLELSSYVWNDVNQNWLRDGSEKGINGVTVALYTEDGKKVATTKTKRHLTHHYIGHHTYAIRQGYFKFKNLAEGEYVVKVETPKGFSSSTTAKLGLWLEENSYNKNNFGIYDKNNKGSYVIKSYVGIDKNKNGKIDYDEKGINNVRVNIYNSEGKKLASTLTKSSGYNHVYKAGYYTFDKLEEGDYSVEIEVPKGMSAKTTTKYIWINTDKTHIDFALN